MTVAAGLAHLGDFDRISHVWRNGSTTIRRCCGAAAI